MSERQSDRSGLLERALGLVGAVLALALLAFLVYQSGFLPDTGPRLTASVAGIEQADGRFVVQLRVKNSGGGTAEGVGVSGALRSGGRVVERASTTIAYVPAGSRRSGALVFEHDPGDGTLAVDVTGYQVP